MITKSQISRFASIALMVAILIVAGVFSAMTAMREHEDLLESLNVIFLIDDAVRLAGTVPLARLFLADGTTPLKRLAQELLLHAKVDAKKDRVTELFDKYNVISLPVVDDDRRLLGVVTADDIISVLRRK